VTSAATRSTIRSSVLRLVRRIARSICRMEVCDSAAKRQSESDKAGEVLIKATWANPLIARNAQEPPETAKSRWSTRPTKRVNPPHYVCRNRLLGQFRQLPSGMLPKLRVAGSIPVSRSNQIQGLATFPPDLPHHLMTMSGIADPRRRSIQRGCSLHPSPPGAPRADWVELRNACPRPDPLRSRLIS
jgi:hypothetical protein